MLLDLSNLHQVYEKVSSSIWIRKMIVNILEYMNLEQVYTIRLCVCSAKHHDLHPQLHFPHNLHVHWFPQYSENLKDLPSELQSFSTCQCTLDMAFIMWLRSLVLDSSARRNILLHNSMLSLSPFFKYGITFSAI